LLTSRVVTAACQILGPHIVHRLSQTWFESPPGCDLEIEHGERSGRKLLCQSLQTRPLRSVVGLTRKGQRKLFDPRVVANEQQRRGLRRSFPQVGKQSRALGEIDSALIANGGFLPPSGKQKVERLSRPARR